MQLIGLLGGTFNPIHFGHLRMAQELAEALNLAEIRFIPSANPPHKAAPTVSAQQRAEMVHLAIADNPLFKLDTRELNRTGASYTIDTLISIREELGVEVSIGLIMGSDAFSKLDSWHRWDELLNYCHIVLVQRPENQTQPKLSSQLTVFLTDNYTENSDDLTEKSAGYIHMQQVTAQEISASKIRENIRFFKNLRYLTPNAVIQFIEANHLYQ